MNSATRARTGTGVPSDDRPPAPRARPALVAGPVDAARCLAPGLCLALGLAVVAAWLGHLLPLIGGTVVAILLGIAVRTAVGLPAALAPGVRFASKHVLQAGIVLLGCGFSLAEVWQTGRGTLVVMLGTLVLGIAVILLLGRWWGVHDKLASLIGVGTGICGASAIGAVAPVIDAESGTVAYAISTIFLFNIAGVLVFPLVGHALRMTQTSFGLWAGTAINDTSSVVAAGLVYGAAAGKYAVVVKLTRSIMIVPVTLLFAVLAKRARAGTTAGCTPGPRTSTGVAHAVPLFIVWFVAAAGLNSLGAFHALGLTALPGLGQFLIVVALAGVGLSADLAAMLRAGLRPIGLGLAGWLTVTVVSQLLQRLT